MAEVNTQIYTVGVGFGQVVTGGQNNDGLDPDDGQDGDSVAEVRTARIAGVAYVATTRTVTGVVEDSERVPRPEIYISFSDFLKLSVTAFLNRSSNSVYSFIVVVVSMIIMGLMLGFGAPAILGCKVANRIIAIYMLAGGALGIGTGVRTIGLLINWKAYKMGDDEPYVETRDIVLYALNVVLLLVASYFIYSTHTQSSDMDKDDYCMALSIDTAKFAVGYFLCLVGVLLLIFFILCCRYRRLAKGLNAINEIIENQP